MRALSSESSSHLEVCRRDFNLRAVAQQENKVTKTHERNFHESPYE